MSLRCDNRYKSTDSLKAILSCTNVTFKLPDRFKSLKIVDTRRKSIITQHESNSNN